MRVRRFTPAFYAAPVCSNGIRTALHYFTLPLIAVISTFALLAQERMISYDPYWRMPSGSSIQAALQMGDTTLVAWGSYAYSSNGILFRQILVQASVSGSRIGMPSVVSDSGAQARDYLKVAKLAGRFVVVWSDKGTRDPGLYARFVSRTGVPQGPPILLEANAQPNAGDVVMFDGDSSLSILCRPRMNEPVVHLVLTIAAEVRRTVLSDVRLERVRPAGGLDAMLVCGTDTCIVLSGNGRIQRWSMPVQSVLSPFYIDRDSTLAVLRDSTLLEYDNVTDVQPTRVRPVRGIPNGAVVQLARDSSGRLVILRLRAVREGDFTIGCFASLVGDADTVSYAPDDTVFWRNQGSGPRDFGVDGVQMHQLRGNGLQMVVSWHIIYYHGRYTTRVDSTTYCVLFPPLIPRPDSLHTGYWYPGTVSLFPARVAARDSSAVTLGRNRFASRLSWSGGLGFTLPNVYNLRGAPAISWFTNDSSAATISGFRTGSGSPWTIVAENRRPSAWVEKGSVVLTPAGTVYVRRSTEQPWVRQIWIGDDQWVPLLGDRGPVIVYSELVAFEPDASAICVLAGDPGVYHIRRGPDSTAITSFTISSQRHLRPSLPLVRDRWLIFTEGRPTHIARYPEADVALACSVAARPGASMVRLRQSGVLRWYAYQDSTGTGTEFERIHVDGARLSAFATGRGRLPGVAPTAEIRVVEDPRSDTVRALFVQGEDLMIARFEPIDFHVIDATRVAPGAVKPTLPSGVIIGDSLYVVWVDRRDVDGAIWGVSIALDATRKRTLSERQVRTPLGQDTIEWLPPEPVPPGPSPDPPLRPPTYSSYELRIWPTPAHEHVRVTTGTAGASSVRFDLLDMRGRLLKTRLALTANQGAAHVVLPVDDVPNGTYLIRVLRGERVEYGRVIVIHPE